MRRRMAHGNIYPAEKIDAALTHYFRAGNLRLTTCAARPGPADAGYGFWLGSAAMPAMVWRTRVVARSLDSSTCPKNSL